MRRRLALAVLLLLGAAAAAPAQAPAAKKEPLFRLEAGGPTSFVNAIAFSSDGNTLYAAGYDKVVRVWKVKPDGTFALDGASYRVPIGPGLSGTINAMALSDDDRWLAAGGRMLMQN